MACFSRISTTEQALNRIDCFCILSVDGHCEEKSNLVLGIGSTPVDKVYTYDRIENTTVIHLFTQRVVTLQIHSIANGHITE